MADADALNQRHLDWSLRGLPILQAPTNMDFGRTFVALDPDGHRLRVFAPRHTNRRGGGTRGTVARARGRPRPLISRCWRAKHHGFAAL